MDTRIITRFRAATIAHACKLGDPLIIDIYSERRETRHKYKIFQFILVSINQMWSVDIFRSNCLIAKKLVWDLVFGSYDTCTLGFE